MRILIISINAIGDTFLSLSAIEPLTIFFSDSISFTFVISADSEFLFEFHPKIKLIKINKDGFPFPNVSNFFLEKYDFVISFFPGRLNGLFVALASAECKYSFASFKIINQWHNKTLPLFNYKLFRFKKTGEYWQPENNFLELVKILIGKIVPQPFKLSKKYFPFHEKSQGTICAHFTSRYRSKSLNPDLAKNIVDFLLEKNQKLLVIADNSTNKLLATIGYSSDVRITYLVYPKLAELVKVIGTSKLFIGCDSFPIHVADAMDKQILGIFGPTDPKSVLVNHEHSIKLPAEILYDYVGFSSIKNKLNELIVED